MEIIRIGMLIYLTNFFCEFFFWSMYIVGIGGLNFKKLSCEEILLWLVKIGRIGGHNLFLVIS
jgi:hypothetical protein